MPKKIDKTKIKELLIKKGNNPKDVEKMVNKHYSYIQRVYGSATISQKANVIKTLGK